MKQKDSSFERGGGGLWEGNLSNVWPGSGTGNTMALLVEGEGLTESSKIYLKSLLGLKREKRTIHQNLCSCKIRQNFPYPGGLNLETNDGAKLYCFSYWQLWQCCHLEKKKQYLDKIVWHWMAASGLWDTPWLKFLLPISSELVEEPQNSHLSSSKMTNIIKICQDWMAGHSSSWDSKAAIFTSDIIWNNWGAPKYTSDDQYLENLPTLDGWRPLGTHTPD